ncbi:MAG: NAD-dependent epimerase/dehydratase family protein [Candidatus Eisenbacteria bacterium]|nr:NAD-dependent epimerase/dehydratase family protein [Candidatus Eisenbacteria bacterium]
MQALVTGGAGFIGSHLTRALLDRGETVVVLDNLSTGRSDNLAELREGPRLRLIVGDARDPATVAAAMEGCDAIFHLAAHVGVRRIVQQALGSLLNNLHCSLTVLEQAARRRLRTIHFSSSEVYGKGRGDVLIEDQDLAIGPPNVSRWSYAAGKAVDESLAMAYHAERGLPVTVVRCFNTCGPRQTGRYGMVLPTFVRQALAGRPLTVHGDGSQTRCFSYVGDVVRGVLALQGAPATVGELFNVGNDVEVTIRELAERIVKLTDSRSPIVTVPYERVFGEPFEDIRRRVPSLQKIRSFIGYQPRVDLDELLRITIESMRTEAPRCDAPAAVAERSVQDPRN